MATSSADLQTVTDGVDLESKPRSAACSRELEEVMDEDEVKKLRASLGDYEAEFSCNGEGGLHQRRKKCDKNPGHLNFIPVKDFNIEHLPSRYRDKLLVDFVQAMSDVTCRVKVSRISGDRPDTWPDSYQPFPFSAYKGKNFMVTGTGWMYGVNKYPEQWKMPCPCDECHRLGNTPKKTWGEVYINTACHVVYDNEEARHTQFQFFYDSHDTDVNKVLTLTGGKGCRSDIKRDKCRMTYATHDVELLDRFDKMFWHWEDLRRKVNRSMQYTVLRVPGLKNVIQYSTTDDHDLCIIVSHPHGCSKVVTVGTWTDREVVEDYGDDDGEVRYSYNTPTCPGSSGAAVFTLNIRNDIDSVCENYAPHSLGRLGNRNSSGEGVEYFNLVEESKSKKKWFYYW